MWRVLVLLVLSQSAFAQPAVESLKAEFEKALNEVKSLQADIRNKQAEIQQKQADLETTIQTVEELKLRLDDVEAFDKKVKKLTDAVSVSEHGNVGIGTTNPEVGLEIKTVDTDHARLMLRADGDSHKEANLHFITKSDSVGWQIFMDDSSLDNLGDGDRLGFWHHNADTSMVLDGSTGNVGIGTIDPKAKLHVNDSIYASHVNGGFVSLNSQSGSIELASGDDEYSFIDFRGKNHLGTDYKGRIIFDDKKFSIEGGDVKIGGNVYAFSHLENSDERLKQNIQPLVSSLAKLAQLRGVSFKWKDEPQDNQIGLVAQEVEKILPEIVSTDSEGYKSIAYGKLTAVLLEAIKEQQQQIEELKGMIKP